MVYYYEDSNTNTLVLWYTIMGTLIPTHLYYGILLWGHDGSRLHSLQKLAISTINISNYNEHTEPTTLF